MKAATRTLAILLACLMAFSLVLTGCGKTEDEWSIYSEWVYESGPNSVDKPQNSGSTDSSGDSPDSSVVSADKTTKPTGGGQVIKPSFEKKDDGTSVDSATGVIFLDDDLDDWSKVYDHGDGMVFDSNEAALMENDVSRVVASARGNSWWSYKLSSGITELGVVTYWASEEENGSFKDVMVFYTSKDGKTWTKLSNPQKQDTSLGFSWTKRVYKFKGIDKSNLFVKIEITAGSKIGYNPNVGRLRINNIDKMDDADRYLEGRASATFYVDPKNGSDNNDGLSEKTAFKSLYKVSSKFFQPGDKILLKAGTSFSGTLSLKGYGDSKNPITVSTYGGKGKATIKARGGTAVTITARYITVENLEVTNSTGDKGIYIMPYGTGKTSNVTVQNCYIHDVNVDESVFTYEHGGIIVYVDGSEPTWIENLTLKNNTIDNVGRCGILLTTMWAYRPGRWGSHPEMYKNDNDGWYPFEKPQVVGNTVTNSRGDGIMVCGARNALIEKNTVLRAFSSTKQEVACAALWTTNTNDSVIQYNDVGYTKLPAGGTDGDGYDIDISEVRTTIQYNYSHNNEGGFLLLCNFGDGDKISKDHIVRYNLSVNDGNAGKAGAGAFVITGSNPNTKIYNNTIYLSKKHASNFIHHFGGTTKDFTFTNNIFMGEAGGTYGFANVGEEWVNAKFDNNIFVNVAPPSGKGITVTNAKTDNPNFANPGATTFEDRAAMIKAFTPKNKISGASAIANNGGKDINGSAIASPFYGCVKY